MIIGELANNKVIIWEGKGEKIYDKGWYGKLKDERLELALVEAMYLLEKKKIYIESNGKKLSKNVFYDYCKKLDSRFVFRYTVYKDLRTKDLPTRTGFKFGCDFRVYEKGVKPVKRGPKQAREHTKWVVFAVPKGYKCSFPELSRTVRLAHNIRANMLWGVVDKDKVEYFQVTFFKP